MSEDVVIVSGARTPVGAFNGAFANVPAHELGKVAIKAALERANVEAGRRFRSHPGPGPDRGAGPEPGAPGLDRRRHPDRNARPGSSTWSAARACAPWRSAHRRSATAISESSSRADRNR